MLFWLCTCVYVFMRTEVVSLNTVSVDDSFSKRPVYVSEKRERLVIRTVEFYLKADEI